MVAYAETVSLCPTCAQDVPARYSERPDGMWLSMVCAEHGAAEIKVESDASFFKLVYEEDYPRPYDHLVLPITYRCNLNCTYCYTLSNRLSRRIPPDRSLEELDQIFTSFSGKITLIGGEPTVRPDLPQLIALAKQRHPGRKVSLGTNGQTLGRLQYAEELRAAGVDFIYLSVNDLAYDGAEVREKKLAALAICRRLRLPVWLHQTVDELPQLGSAAALIEEFKEVVFNVTIRAVKPMGLVHPTRQIYVSDMLRYLGKEKDHRRGFNFFNREITLAGKKVRLCSWVTDVGRLDPVDSRYIISDNTWTTFHRGMKVDELLLRKLVETDRQFDKQGSP